VGRTRGGIQTTSILERSSSVKFDEYDEKIIKKLFSRRVITDSGCWEWQGAKTGAGYGSIYYCGIYIGTHVLSMRLFASERYNKKLQVNHICNNPICFNPEHLYSGTASDNLYDAYSNGYVAWCSKLTHCWRGHEFTIENTIKRKDGGRECKACQAYRRTYYDK
jgi:hypothetical protein